MLVNFEFSNFRSFYVTCNLNMVAIKRIPDKQAHIRLIRDLPILKAAGIYGGNGSGKTNLFRAIEFVKDISTIEGYMESVEFNRQYEKNLLISDNSNTSEFTITFSINEKFYSLYYEVDYNEIITEELLEIKYPGQKKENEFLIYRREQGVESFFSKEYFQSKEIKVLKFITNTTVSKHNSLIALDGMFISIPLLLSIKKWFLEKVKFIYPSYKKLDIAYLLHTKPNYLVNMRKIIKYSQIGIENIDISYYPINIFFGKSDENSRSFIEDKLYNSDINNYSFEDSKGNICSAIKNNETDEIQILKLIFYHLNDQKELVPFDMDLESRGTQSFINLIPAILSTYEDNVTYFIDEIGVSIHPILIHKIIFEYFKNNLDMAKGQLIYNSHHTYLMDQNISRRDEYWSVTRTPRGSILKPFTNFGSIRTDEKIENKYIEGRYGGTPFSYDPGPLVLQS